jgi:hypothetical protein
MAFVYATPEKVALGWAAGIFGTDMVGAQLPAPDSDGNLSWAASGYITLAALSTGLGAHMYYRFDRPVVSFQCWAASPDTGRPPWGKAANLAETIRVQGCYANQPVSVTVPDASENARVLSSYLVSEPRRVYSDQGDYAAFVVDVQLFWVATPKP